MITKQQYLKGRLLTDNLFFTRYFFIKQYNRKFIVGDHHKIIAEHLDKVFRGEITRLIINIAPRYGKTEQVVKAFISQGLAINPKSKYIHTSYSDVLALDNAESIKDLIHSEHYQDVFPYVSLKKDSKSKKKFYTEQKGGVYSAASGGQITGFGAGLVDENEDDYLNEFIADGNDNLLEFGGAIVIDDPIKPEDAESELVRTKINERFDNTIRSRTNSRKTPIIIIMQRVHEFDLTGYLLQDEDWIHLNLPVIKEDGTSLWPFKHTIDELYKLRKLNYKVFTRQYMQDTKAIQSGGEFLKSFNIKEHIKPASVDTEKTIHISIDSNVLPYIAVTIWQIEKEHIIKGDKNYTKYHCYQVHELPAKDPINTARKSALNVARWLEQIGYDDKIFIYGDPTTKNSNNIDDNKRSFFALFTGTLLKEGFTVQDKMSRRNKSVSSMGDFVNAIFENRIDEISITIGEHNKLSINDYIETKQDLDGGILKKRETDTKTKASFEPHGHLTDTLKDFICQAFSSQFLKFKSKRMKTEAIVTPRRTRIR